MSHRAILETEYPSLRTAAQRYGVDVDELKQVVARLVSMTPGIRSSRPSFRKTSQTSRQLRTLARRSKAKKRELRARGRALAYGKAHYRKKAARRRGRATRAAR